MSIVSQFSWDDIASADFGNPARKAFREAVEVVAVHAREKLPQAVNGRIDAACKIVLQGDVELLPDDKARVGSQTQGTTTYHIVDGTCDCRDFAQSPDHWCKHRIAFGIYKRATALAKQRLEQLDASSNGTTTPAPEQVDETPVATPVQESVATPALPEAPASVNFHTTIAGRQIQITLRDMDETRLLARLETLLKRFPVEQEKQEGECPIHHVQMRLNRGKNGRKDWWSHKTADGWCNGK